jgi:hypothetical protein
MCTLHACFAEYIVAGSTADHAVGSLELCKHSRNWGKSKTVLGVTVESVSVMESWMLLCMSE